MMITQRRALLTSVALTAALLALSSAARAHHGVAVVSAAGPEGPGAALDTMTAVPLRGGMVLGLLRTEIVPFRRYGFAEPENKELNAFNMLGVGYGLRPWLSAFLFQPYNLKDQQTLGRNAAFGDPTVMLSLAFKIDEGLRLVPERESLDELEDWHFAVWISSTIPIAPTERSDAAGARFSPDMQTGFGAPSPAVGLAVLKQLSADLTWLADAARQQFLAHTYSTTRYQFGTETRLNAALAYRAWAGGRTRLDLVPELGFLHLARDRERDAGGAMVSLSASGGTIVYAGASARLFWGPFSAALGVKRAALTWLNEEADQQGAEGRERFRATFVLSYVPGWI